MDKFIPDFSIEKSAPSGNEGQRTKLDESLVALLGIPNFAIVQYRSGEKFVITS
jgi:hypothetical protein